MPRRIRGQVGFAKVDPIHVQKAGREGNTGRDRQAHPWTDRLFDQNGIEAQIAAGTDFASFFAAPRGGNRRPPGSRSSQSWGLRRMGSQGLILQEISRPRIKPARPPVFLPSRPNTGPELREQFA